MRRMLEDHGIAVVALEGCNDWVPPPADAPAATSRGDSPLGGAPHYRV
jgi:hypothetical protein